MFTSLVALSITFILFQNTWLTWLGKFLVIQDTLEPGDVIHVIAGDDYRTDYAFQLYREGYAKKIFFTGGWCETHLYGHGARAREKALAQGVPLDVIASDDSAAMSTYMEAERLKDRIAKNSSPPIKSIIVVSDPFHMRRARWTYQRVFGEQIQIQMAPVLFAVRLISSTGGKMPAVASTSKRNISNSYFIYFVMSIAGESSATG